MHGLHGCRLHTLHLCEDYTGCSPCRRLLLKCSLHEVQGCCRRRRSIWSLRRRDLRPGAWSASSTSPRLLSTARYVTIDFCGRSFVRRPSLCVIVCVMCTIGHHGEIIGYYPYVFVVHGKTLLQPARREDRYTGRSRKVEVENFSQYIFYCDLRTNLQHPMGSSFVKFTLYHSIHE
jgi:hypothetical protein